MSKYMTETIPELTECHKIEDIKFETPYTFKDWKCTCGKNVIKVLGDGNVAFIFEIYIECANCHARYIITSCDSKYSVRAEGEPLQ